jgi:hypothetical protein
MPLKIPPMNDLDSVGCSLPHSCHFSRSRLLEGVDFRTPLVSLLLHQRYVDGAAWNSIFFRQPVREDCRDSSVKEVENSIVDVLKANSQFLYSVAEKVGFRPTQLMAHFRESLDSDSALVLRPRRQAVEPFQNRHCAVGLAIENDPSLGHVTSLLSGFAKLRKAKCVSCPWMCSAGPRGARCRATLPGI